MSFDRCQEFPQLDIRGRQTRYMIVLYGKREMPVFLHLLSPSISASSLPFHSASRLNPSSSFAFPLWIFITSSKFVTLLWAELPAYLYPGRTFVQFVTVEAIEPVDLIGVPTFDTEVPPD